MEFVTQNTSQFSEDAYDEPALARTYVIRPISTAYERTQRIELPSLANRRLQVTPGGVKRDTRLLGFMAFEIACVALIFLALLHWKPMVNTPRRSSVGFTVRSSDTVVKSPPAAALSSLAVGTPQPPPSTVLPSQVWPFRPYVARSVPLPPDPGFPSP